VTAAETLLQLHDLDLLLAESRDRALAARYRRAGFAVGEPGALEKSRERLAARLEARWRPHYERAFARYGFGVAAVRARVCQGCFMTLPRSVSPGENEMLMLCESCGRILLWEPRAPA
jgi:hypothetical protein